MKTIQTIAILLLCLFTSVAFAQTKAKIEASDFDVLIGHWEGSLTYLDYTSGQPYTMPANVDISRSDKAKNLVLAMSYPNEPKANGSENFVLSGDGSKLNKGKVVSKTKLSDGALQIVTEQSGKDGNDNKRALFKLTYIISRTSFSIRKEVQFVGETEWIKRHEYSFERTDL
jgi:hypothetical protein